jgi:hypothetical protein
VPLQGKHALQFTPDDYISAALNLYLDVINVSAGNERGSKSRVAAGVVGVLRAVAAVYCFFAA